ncbi:response regulator [Rhodanobacter sp. C03]|uniref:response regulator n=1 Tax=Rhodanobacter sp. C03 TaxID=1945858 RepID=UPI0009876610|nr:response regulator [Rhodanobacter sp. C03]OOG56280.1 response regulator [Rhodanobacter sp. C03]
MPSHSNASVIDPADSVTPRVLVADDDPASCRFLCDGLRSLGAQALACGDGTTALAHARTGSFDLLLLDCRMPGAGALQVLNALRGDVHACSANSIAVATSAELAPRDRQSLLAAGFSEILLKPCGLADLQRMLALVRPELTDACVLDDQAALTSSGDAATMHALRQLLREELVQLERELEPLSRDPDGFGERLHRLRSSCGFCGATALSTQTVWLQQQLSQRDLPSPAALARFRKALLATLQALDR